MDTQRAPQSSARRRLLAALGAATGATATGVLLPERWIKPIVNAVVVPVHAQGSLPPVDTGSFAASGTPTPLPPSGTAGTTSVSIDVSGLTGTIVAVRLDLDITHTWIGDLQVELSGAGQSDVILMANPCGNVDNMNVTLDDTAASQIGSNCSAPVTGTYSSNGGNAFSAFVGGSPNGTWTLEVIDEVGGDAGSLNSATLHIDTTG